MLEDPFCEPGKFGSLLVAELDLPDSKLDIFDELSPSLIDGFNVSILGLISYNDGYFLSTLSDYNYALNEESFFKVGEDYSNSFLISVFVFFKNFSILLSVLFELID